MSTTSPPRHLPLKYRRKSLCASEEPFSPSPTKSDGRYFSLPPSSSPIRTIPRAVTPLSSELSPFGFARIQSSPRFEFEIGVHDVDYNDDHAMASGWATGYGEKMHWKNRGSPTVSPSFSSSFSPTDDELPPPSDFDASEFSEEMDVDIMDLSADESGSRDQRNDEFDPEITEDEHDEDVMKTDGAYSVSAERNPWTNVSDSADFSIAVALLDLQRHPRLGTASSTLALPSISTHKQPTPALSDDHPAATPITERLIPQVETPASPLSPLPPSPLPMSSISLHTDEHSVQDIPNASAIDDASFLRSDATQTFYVPHALSQVLHSSPTITFPTESPRLHEYLEHLDRENVADQKDIGYDKKTPPVKQPLVNKQNQPYPGQETGSTSAVAMSIDMGAGNLSSLSSRPVPQPSICRELLKKESKRPAETGTRVKVTQVMRVKRKESELRTWEKAKIEKAKQKDDYLDRGEKGVAAAETPAKGKEKRKKHVGEDGSKRKRSRTLPDEDDVQNVKTVQGGSTKKTETSAMSLTNPRKKTDSLTQDTSGPILKARPEETQENAASSRVSTERKPSNGPSRVTSSKHSDGSSDNMPSSSKASLPPAPEEPEISLASIQSEMQGFLIETFATSRASSMSPSSLYKAVMQSRPGLKTQRSKTEWIAIIEEVLAEERERRGIFERVESSGKDDSDRPLEAQWYYVPEHDEDQERAELIRSMMPRLEKRKETRKYKQYFWQPLEKMSRWDGEDEM